MLLCARLSAAAYEPGLFSLRFHANRVKDVTLSACTGRTFHRHRFLCTGGPNRENWGKEKTELVQNWGKTGCFVSTEWVAAVAGRLSQNVYGKGGKFDHITVFNRELSAGLCFITQTRSSSTMTSTKKSEKQADNKESIQETSPTSTTIKSAEEALETEGEKPNKALQLKKVFKEYGAVGVSFHIGISLMSLGMFYLLISSGMDIGSMLCKLGFSETVVQSKLAAGTSTFVLAYAIHKLFAPARISITLVSVPLIVRYFRKTGLFKPPTPAP